jgi:hypothetical protein
MSHASESLTKRLQRLDKWIAETERVADVATDSETRQQIANDLTRWRESRRACAKLLVRTKWLNRAASTTMTMLLASFVGMAILAICGSPQSAFTSVLLAIDYLVLFGSTLAYLPLIAWRDSVARGGEPWRFSLAGMLSLMTGIALALGFLAWFMRR